MNPFAYEPDQQSADPVFPSGIPTYITDQPAAPQQSNNPFANYFGQDASPLLNAVSQRADLNNAPASPQGIDWVNQMLDVAQNSALPDPAAIDAETGATPEAPPPVEPGNMGGFAGLNDQPTEDVNSALGYAFNHPDLSQPQPQDNDPLDNYIKLTAQGMDALRSWAQTDDGKNAIGDETDAFNNDPYGFMLGNSIFGHTLFGAKSLDEVTNVADQLKLPQAAIDGLMAVASTPAGARMVAPEVDAQNAAYTQPLTDELKNHQLGFLGPFAAPITGGLASGVAGLVGTAVGGPEAGAAAAATTAAAFFGSNAGVASGRTDLPSLLGQGLGAGAQAVMFGGPASAASEAIGGAVGGALAGSSENAALQAAAPAIGRVAGGLGTFVPLDTGTQAAQMALQGQSPQDIGAALLGNGNILQSPLAMDVTMAVIPSLKDAYGTVPVPHEAVNAGLAYGATLLMGGSQQEAIRNAALIGGATVIREDGFQQALKSGFGLGDVLAKLQGVAPGEASVGLNIKDVSAEEPEYEANAGSAAVGGGFDQSAPNTTSAETTPTIDTPAPPTAENPTTAGTQYDPATDEWVTTNPDGTQSRSSEPPSGPPTDTGSNGAGGEEPPEEKAAPLLSYDPTARQYSYKIDDNTTDVLPDPQQAIEAAPSQISTDMAANLAKAANIAPDALKPLLQNASDAAKAVASHTSQLDRSSRINPDVQESAIAYANMVHTNALHLSNFDMPTFRRMMEPLLGGTNTIVKGLANAAPAAAGASIFATQGNNANSRLALIAGLGASGLLMPSLTDAAVSRTIGKSPLDGLSIDMEKVINGEDPDMATALKRVPYDQQPTVGKFYMVLQHPDWFNLNPAQSAAVDSLKNLVDAKLEYENAARKTAGLDRIDPLEDRGLLQEWTRASLKKSGLAGVGLTTRLPTQLSRTASELQRSLGDYVTAKALYPDLQLAFKTPEDAFAADMTAKYKGVATAVFTQRLKSAGAEDTLTPALAIQDGADSAYQAAKEDAANGKITGDELLRYRDARDAAHEATFKAMQDMETAGVGGDWSPLKEGAPIQGLNGYVFPPDVVKSVGDMVSDDTFGVLDRATATMRNLMFTTHLTPITLNGVMLLASDPINGLVQFTRGMGSAVWQKGFENFYKDNQASIDQAAMAGQRFSYETISDKRSLLEHLPVVHNVSTRLWNNYLTTTRASMFDNLVHSQALVESIPDMKLPPLNWTADNLATWAIQGAKMAPLAGSAAYVMANSKDLNDWEKAAILAFGGLGSLGTDIAINKLGDGAFEKLSPEEQQGVRARAADMVNTTSGAFNREQSGVTANRAQFERNFIARSPAFARNAAAMLKTAITDPTAKGAMARVYLAQSAITYASLLYGISVMDGKPDSLDPRDPNSFLSRQNFGAVNIPGAGRTTFVNPYLSIARAILATPYVVGGSGEGYGGGFHPGAALSSITSAVTGRTPDIMGQVENPALNALSAQVNPDQKQYPSALQSLIGAARSGSPQQILGALGQAAPVSLQSAAESGAFSDLGIKGNPNVTTPAERIGVGLSGLVGTHTSPTSLYEKAVVQMSDDIKTMFPDLKVSDPSGVATLNDLDAKQREQFDASDAGKRDAAAKTSALPTGNQAADPVSGIINQQDQAKDDRVATLKKLNDAYLSGQISGEALRKAVSDANQQYYNTLNFIDQTAAKIPYGKPYRDPTTGKTVTSGTVADFLNKGQKPEDAAVSGYYNLDNQATNADGTLDYTKLANLQTQYMANLDPQTRGYVHFQLDYYNSRGVLDSKGNAVSLPALTQLNQAKSLADQYFQIQDQAWKQYAGNIPQLQQFGSYSDVLNWADQNDAKNGYIPGISLKLVEVQYPQVALAAKVTSAEERIYLMQHTDALNALQKFYGYTPSRVLAVLGGATVPSSFGNPLAVPTPAG